MTEDVVFYPSRHLWRGWVPILILLFSLGYALEGLQFFLRA